MQVWTGFASWVCVLTAGAVKILLGRKWASWPVNPNEETSNQCSLLTQGLLVLRSDSECRPDLMKDIRLLCVTRKSVNCELHSGRKWNNPLLSDLPKNSISHLKTGSHWTSLKITGLTPFSVSMILYLLSEVKSVWFILIHEPLLGLRSSRFDLVQKVRHRMAEDSSLTWEVGGRGGHPFLLRSLWIGSDFIWKSWEDSGELHSWTTLPHLV